MQCPKNSQLSIKSLIGQGSYGSVFLVEDKNHNQYALKKINVSPFQSDAAKNQIQIMSKFVHPNLIRIYGSTYNQVQQTLQIVMQYCEGGDLLNYYKGKNKKLTASQIMYIFREIVQAFIVMNVKGVIHRDLKPQNILITKNNRIKVADFGCARSVNLLEVSQIQNFSVGKGTPMYASPSQLLNEKYSAKCDVWAIGCILYFIYYGTHPFMNSKSHKIISLVKEKTEDKQIELKEDTDPSIAQSISLTLIYNEKQRASWKQLWLSRLFNEKIKDIQSFIQYLRTTIYIANWLTKQFWKNRKKFNIKNNKDYILAYFLIKYQYTCMDLAIQILKKNKRYLYMIDLESFEQFIPDDELYQNYVMLVTKHEKHYQQIKQTMIKKNLFKLVQERQPKRISCFSDLDNSIRTGYYILVDIHKDIFNNQQQHLPVWIVLAKWINFSKWMLFQAKPNLDKIVSDHIKNIAKFISDQLQRYQSGKI